MLNGDGDWGDVSKIFAKPDFGYHEIRVERPLKLAFEVTSERLKALREAKAFAKLDEDARSAILESLESYLAGERW